MAQARGIPVRSITLFALGGIAQMERDANSAKSEFLIAVVGPIASFLIGFACLGVALSLGWSPDPDVTGGGGAGGVLGWLGSINILLAVFNLIPRYPLDSGRILRAILWGYYGDGARATRSAARTGQVVAGLFIAFGLLQFFLGAGLGGLWLAFIGWFLLSAAQASYAEVTLTEALRGVAVADIMSQDCVSVDPGTTVQDLVDDIVLRSGRRCVMVASGDHVLGLVTPNEARAIERSRWPEVPIVDIMRPLEQVRSVQPDTPAIKALEMMARDNLNQLPGIDRGDLRRIVSRGQILRLIQARSELGR